MSRARLCAWLTVAVALAAVPVARDASAEAPSPAYGAMSLGPTVAPFGPGSSLESECLELGAATCSTPAAWGAAFSAHYGRRVEGWPVAVEGGLRLMADASAPSARYDGVPHLPQGNPLLSSPARDESFVLGRVGIALLARARLTSSGARRWSLAAGPGLSIRHHSLVRRVRSDDGGEDRPLFDAPGFTVAPALSIDGSLQLYATDTLRVAVGIDVFVDTAWSGPRSTADTGRMLTGGTRPVPLPTPAYTAASGLQLTLGPYLGLAFGP